MPSAAAILQSLQDGVSNVVTMLTGIVSAAGRVFTTTISAVANAGAQLVNVLSSVVQSVANAMSGMLGPLGPLAGAAMGVLGALVGALGNVASVVSTFVSSVVSVIGTVISSVVSVVSTFVSAVGAALTAIGSVIGAIGGTIPAILGSVLQVATSFVSIITGVLTAVSGAITGVITGIVSAISSMTDALGEAIGGIIGSISAIFSAFGSVLKSSVDALTKFSHDVSGIRNQTGMNLGASLELTNTFRAMGISSDETARIFGARDMNPTLFNARAVAMGAPTMGADFGPQFARWFQDNAKTGVGGFLGARAQADALFGGQTPDSVLRLANANPDALQRNLDYGKSLQSDLGIGPGAVEAAGELSLLMDRVGQFVSMIQERFSADLLPALQAGFGIVSNFFTSNAGAISDALTTAAHAIFVDGPSLAIDAARTVLDWGQGLANIFFAVGDAAVSLIQSLGNRQGVFYDILKIGATFLDNLVEFGAQFAGVMARFGAIFHNVGVILGMETGWQNPAKAQQKAYDNLHRDTGFADTLDLTLLNNKKDILDSADSMSASLTRGRANTDKVFDTVRGGIDKFEGMAGSRDSREAVFQASQQVNLAVDKTTTEASAGDQSHGEKFDKMIDILGRMVGLNQEQLDELRGHGIDNVMSKQDILTVLTGAVAGEAYRTMARG